MDRLFISDYNIVVPVGKQVPLDGSDISSYKRSTSEDGTKDIYVIDKMLSGDHTISVTLDDSGEITKTEYVTDNNANVEITTEDFAMKPDVKQKIYEYSTFIVKTMYE